MRKYGFNNFKIEVIESKLIDDMLNERERYWIAYYHSFIDEGQGYNLTIGGSQNTKLSKSTIDKHRYNALNGITGHTHLPKEQVYTKAVRQKMSDANKGKKMSIESKQKIREALTGRHISDKTKEKLRIINTGRHHSEKTKKKISEIKKQFLSDKKNHNFYGKYEIESPRHCVIYQYSNDWKLIHIFGSKREVLKYLGLKGHTQLNNAIKDKHIYKDYYWTEEAVETIEITQKRKKVE